MSLYVIGLCKDGDKIINHFVEEVIFRNHYYKEFTNTTCLFTDNLQYALKIKSKPLAEELCKVTQLCIPTLKIVVLTIEDAWYKL